MTKHTDVDLGEHFATFIDAKISEGLYADASDVIRAGLTLLEDEEARLAAVRAALIEGEESGQVEVFDIEKFIAKKRAQGNAA